MVFVRNRKRKNDSPLLYSINYIRPSCVLRRLYVLPLQFTWLLFSRTSFFGVSGGLNFLGIFDLVLSVVLG